MIMFLAWRIGMMERDNLGTEGILQSPEALLFCYSAGTIGESASWCACS